MNKVIISIVFLLLYIQSQCQVLTFDSVKSAILARNPAIQSYKFQSKAYDAMAEGATAWEAPQIGAGFFMTPYKTSYWKDRNETVKGMPTMMPGMGSFMIQAKQMIPNPLKLKANKKYQSSLSLVEGENAKAKANELLYEAKVKFHEIQIIDKKLKILANAKVTVETMINISEKKIAFNQESLSTIYKAKSQAAILEKDKYMMEGERKQKFYALNGLMFIKNEPTFSIDTAIIIKDYELAIADTSLIPEQRSDIVAMKKNISAMSCKQKAESVKGKPDFGIEYGHMFAFGSNPNQFTIMGMVSVPLVPWSSKMYKSSTKALAFEIEAMKSQRDAMISETINMAKGLKTEISSAKYQLKIYKEVILPSLKKSYDVAMIAYTNNTGELFTALDARMAFQMAEMQYWDVMLNLLKLEAQYEKELQLL